MSANTARTSGQVAVLITSTTVSTNYPGRSEITIVNIDATNPVFLAFAVPPATGGIPVPAGPAIPTATANNGLRLAAGASWTTNNYTGPIAAIATGGTVTVTVAEF
jgi:hypothetical protein